MTNLTIVAPIDPEDEQLVVVPLPREFGTYYRYQQGDDIVLEPVNARQPSAGGRARVATSNVLERYFRRHELDPNSDLANLVMFESGVALRRDFIKAHIVQRVTTRYPEARQVQLVATNRRPALAQDLMADREQSYRDWQDAVRHVGPVASDEVVEACCLDQAVGVARMIILRRGLLLLADFYGLVRIED
jgi:hypothetical protein